VTKYIGVGYRSIQIESSSSRKEDKSDDPSKSPYFQYDSYMDLKTPTIQWMLFTSEGLEWRIGFLWGIGTLKYSFQEHSTEFRNLASTSTRAMTSGGFLDWGGGLFGARITTVYIKTDPIDVEFDNTVLSIDGSYSGLMLEIRWAL